MLTHLLQFRYIHQALLDDVWMVKPEFGGAEIGLTYHWHQYFSAVRYVEA